MIFVVNDGKRIICICENITAAKAAIGRNFLLSESLEVWTKNNIGEYRFNSQQTTVEREKYLAGAV